MPWFPVDDAFHGHPKARRAGFEAIGLWTVAGSYCMAYLTDGFVPEWFVKEKPRGIALAKRLVAAGLWQAGEKDGDAGWWFHDWKPECTKAHVLAVRENARQRKAKSRESHDRSHVTDGVTDGVSPPSCLVPTQPNPTQPSTPVVDSGGGVTQVAALGPRPECPDHEENSETACRKCRRRREWDESAARQVESDELERRRAAKAAAAQALLICKLCDEYGWVLGPDGTPVEPPEKCKHPEARHA